MHTVLLGSKKKKADWQDWQKQIYFRECWAFHITVCFGEGGGVAAMFGGAGSGLRWLQSDPCLSLLEPFHHSFA